MLNESLRKLAVKDGRYSPEAFQFLFESLDAAVKLAGRENAEGTDRHVSGQELLAGLRQCASEVFGPLAAEVWRAWGIHDSLDWGRIVFLLVEAGMLNRQENDSLDDFRHGFDFDEVFVDAYEPRFPSELFARPTGEEGHAPP
jgi:uncharacterized repeat protein (TIGR04138 family)